MAEPVFYLQGGTALRHRLDAIRRVGSVGVMRDIGEDVVTSARQLVPRKTGALSASIRVGAVQPRSVEVLAGGGKVQYAAAQEFGARPHVIRARRKRNLVFWWEKAGLLFRGPAVLHPGNPARPYFRPAVEGTGIVYRLKTEVINLWNAAA